MYFIGIFGEDCRKKVEGICEKIENYCLREIFKGFPFGGNISTSN